jgi:hypothetical protein
MTTGITPTEELFLERAFTLAAEIDVGGQTRRLFVTGLERGMLTEDPLKAMIFGPGHLDVIEAETAALNFEFARTQASIIENSCQLTQNTCGSGANDTIKFLLETSVEGSSAHRRAVREKLDVEKTLLDLNERLQVLDADRVISEDNQRLTLFTVAPQAEFTGLTTGLVRVAVRFPPYPSGGPNEGAVLSEDVPYRIGDAETMTFHNESGQLFTRDRDVRVAVVTREQLENLPLGGSYPDDELKLIHEDPGSTEPRAILVLAPRRGPVFIEPDPTLLPTPHTRFVRWTKSDPLTGASLEGVGVEPPPAAPVSREPLALPTPRPPALDAVGVGLILAGVAVGAFCVARWITRRRRCARGAAKK